MNWDIKLEFIDIEGDCHRSNFYLNDDKDQIDTVAMINKVKEIIMHNMLIRNCYLTWLEIREVSP